MRTQLESVPCRRVRERLGVSHNACLKDWDGERKVGGERRVKTGEGGGGKRLEDGGCGPP